ncbi:MAG: DUF1329 domain-containing protein [Pseudomonadota bacterium]|nr:DUF1329 domain-containing protein [Pseudomonadota bacterium]
MKHLRLCCLLLLMHPLWSPLAAASLSAELTPVGAERAANADGSIPAWNADQYSPQEHLQWMREITAENPVYQITADNLEQHQSLLAPGLRKMLALYPETFAIPVYPSHRTARQPQWTYDNTRKNLDDARISESGDELLAAWPGTPFPVPDSPQEIIWNHQTRWKGVFFFLHLYENTVYPSRLVDSLETVIESYATYYDPQRQSPNLDWRNLYYFSHILGPARLAGGGLLIHESLQPKRHPRQAWIYITGERRMRRIPTSGYDAPLFNAEGLRVVDEIDVFNGPLDRYNWELVGKREMLIPYNNQKMRYNRCDDPQALTPYHISPRAMRFEKHRVWVVESRLKPDQRHLYQRRTFYVDEDTWSIVMVDIYDKDDELWRFTLRFSAYYEQMPGMFSSMDAYHDLDSGAYFLQCSAGEGTTFYQQPPPDGYFSPVNIRKRLLR